MFKFKFIQIVTVCFQLCLLFALFIPVIEDYGTDVTIWSKIIQSFKTANAEYMLTFSFYYLPNIITMILLIVFKSKVKYLLSAVASSFGLSIVLIQYIFPAVANPYLFYVYSAGVYIILSLQVAVIILCIIGVSLGNPENDNLPYVNLKKDTQEILINDINNNIK